MSNFQFPSRASRDAYLRDRAKRDQSQRRKNLLMKWFLTICTVVIVCLPATLFFLLKGALQPDGFWQNFAVWVVGIAVFGGLQIWMIVAGLGILATVIWN